MKSTETEKEGGIINLDEVRELIKQAREVQVRLYGFNCFYSLHRWAMIIGEEYGKLCKPVNELSKILDGEAHAEREVIIRLQEVIRQQLIEIATCCVAMLQEAPSLHMSPNQHQPGCRCRLCRRSIRPDQLIGEGQGGL